MKIICFNHSISFFSFRTHRRAAYLFVLREKKESKAIMITEATAIPQKLRLEQVAYRTNNSITNEKGNLSVSVGTWDYPKQERDGICSRVWCESGEPPCLWPICCIHRGGGRRDML